MEDRFLLRCLSTRNKRGFTLVELMIVVMIVGVLVSIGLPSFKKQLLKGHLQESKPYLMEIAAKLRIREKEFGLVDFPSGDSMAIEQDIEDVLGVDLQDSGEFCYRIVVDNFADNSNPGPEFEVWAILRYQEAADAGENVVADLKSKSCTTADEKNASASWAEEYTEKSVVMRYPPGTDGPQEEDGVTVHDWVNGVSMYNVLY